MRQVLGKQGVYMGGDKGPVLLQEKPRGHWGEKTQEGRLPKSALLNFSKPHCKQRDWPSLLGATCNLQ